MGMFDYIIIDDVNEITGLNKPLIEQTSSNRPQTKSLENTMTTFVIRDRRLFKTFQRREDTDKVSFETQGYTFYESRVIEEWQSPFPYHGDISMIAWYEDEQRVFLIARFSYDKLDYIKVDEEQMAYEIQRQAKFKEAHRED